MASIDPAARPRLLLVDDDPDNLELLTVLLGQTYEVCSYGSAEEALAALDAVKPAAVLLDIGMRPVDGLQCLEAIRRRPGYVAIPAVAVTAFARDVERETFLGGGFQAVVTKPILDPGDLVGVIEAVLRSACSRSDPSAAAVP